MACVATPNNVLVCVGVGVRWYCAMGVGLTGRDAVRALVSCIYK